MAKRTLAAMTVDALLDLRDEVGRALSRRADELRARLGRLGDDDDGGGGRKGRRKGTSLKGRKVPPKYRGPEGETWAGRGARPRWLQEALKQGKKPEDFLIAGASTSAGAKKTSRAKRRKRKAA